MQGMRAAIDKEFTARMGDRADVPNVLLVMTDGLLVSDMHVLWTLKAIVIHHRRIEETDSEIERPERPTLDMD